MEYVKFFRGERVDEMTRERLIEVVNEMIEAEGHQRQERAKQLDLMAQRMTLRQPHYFS